jgi:probable HAF family extracellular repeat protein
MSKMTKRNNRTALLGLGLALALTLPAAAQYSPNDLGILGGDFSVAMDMNDLGVVTGRSKVPDPDAMGGTVARAFIWTADGGIVELGTLGGDSSQAKGINNLNQIVGKSRNAADTDVAYVWSEATGMVELGTLGGAFSVAEKINDLGQVVGQSNELGQQTQGVAFLWDDVNGMVSLGTLGGDVSIGYDINNLGEVVGSADDVNGNSRAFLWSESQGMIDLGTLGGDIAAAFAINNQSQVVGYSENAAGEGRSFLWDAVNGMVDLGLVGDGPLDFFEQVECLAYGINDLGEVTGRCINSDSTNRRAYLWKSSTGMVELATLGGQFGEGRAINNLSQVVGSSKLSGGDRHGTLWTQPLAITTTSLPDADLGVAYSELIDFEGGVGPYAWSITLGALPLGLTLDAATGEIAGTPTEPGVFPITVNLDEGLGSSTTADLTLNVNDSVDTLQVLRAIWRSNNEILIVQATSSSGGDVVLNVEGFGNLRWIEAAGFHRKAWRMVTENPVEITINSSGGGSITVPVQAF